MKNQRERIERLLRANHIVTSYIVLKCMGEEPDGLAIARAAIRERVNPLTVEFYIRQKKKIGI